MPNWCECEMTVTALTKQELIDFFVFAEQHDNEGKFVCAYDENKFVPKPAKARWVAAMQEEYAKAFPNTIKEYGEYVLNGFVPYTWDWYDWQVKNWGSKWGICDDENRVLSANKDDDCEGIVEEVGGLFVITTGFSSPWCPPEHLFVAMATKFPNLSFAFKWWEPGMGFKGSLTFEKGELTGSTDEEYVYDEEEE